MPGHGFTHGTFPSPVHTQSRWWPEAILEFTALLDEVIKPGLRASAEGEESLSHFESSGSLSILSGAQAPVLLQCYKASLTKSRAKLLATNPRALNSSAKNVCVYVCVWLGERLPSLAWVIYEMSLYEVLINWNDATWSLQQQWWTIDVGNVELPEGMKDHRWMDVRSACWLCFLWEMVVRAVSNASWVMMLGIGPLVAGARIIMTLFLAEHKTVWGKWGLSILSTLLMMSLLEVLPSTHLSLANTF